MLVLLVPLSLIQARNNAMLVSMIERHERDFDARLKWMHATAKWGEVVARKLELPSPPEPPARVVADKGEQP